MLFDDEEIGGKTLTPATKRYFGNVELAEQYLWRGQLLLGELKRRMQLAELPDGYVDAELPGPVLLRAKSNQWGLADIDEIWIDVSAISAATTAGSKSCIGFVAHVLGENEQLFVRGPNDAVNEVLSTFTADPWARFAGQGNYVPGAIPGTMDSASSYILNFTWEIYFGTQTITTTSVMDEGVHPQGIYAPSWAAQINAGYFVPTNSWEYSTTTVTYDYTTAFGNPPVITTYEITVDQIQPNIYTGGYRVVEPSGDVVKTDPVDGWTFFGTYANEVCGMPVDDAQYFIGGANIRTTADAWLAQYPTILEDYYSNRRGAVAAEQAQYAQPVVLPFAPTATIRNKYNHIATSAEPTEIALGAITAGPSSTDAFISVLPGPTTYTFADEDNRWYNEAYAKSVTVTEEMFDLELPGGAYFLNLGFNPLQTATESTMRGLGGNSIFVEPESPIKIIFTFTQERVPDWHAFTAEAAVAPGDYLVIGTGTVKLTLLIESIDADGQKTYSFEAAEFQQMSWSFDDATVIKVGTPFTSLSEIVRAP